MKALHFKAMLKGAGRERSVKRLRFQEGDLEAYRTNYEVSFIPIGRTLLTGHRLQWPSSKRCMERQSMHDSASARRIDPLPGFRVWDRPVKFHKTKISL